MKNYFGPNSHYTQFFSLVDKKSSVKHHTDKTGEHETASKLNNTNTLIKENPEKFRIYLRLLRERNLFIQSENQNQDVSVADAGVTATSVNVHTDKDSVD